MELRQLRHLMAVVEHGSFSRAAEAVHLTQPALTRSIQALEASVGAAVLERNRGSMAPTDVGRLLLSHARLLDSATRDLERDIALTQGLELGELRIGVGPYGGSTLVGPAIGQLNQAHPGLRLKTVLAPWQELPERVRTRDVDLIVVELSQVLQMDDFGVQPLNEHPMVAVCRPDHPLTRLPAPTAAQLFSYPVAGPSLTAAQSALLQGVIHPQGGGAGPKRSLLSVECDLASLLKDVLRHSDAVSLMPEFMVSADVRLGQLVRLPGPHLGLRLRFGCAWLKARTLSPAALRFMALLADHDRALVAHSAPEG